MPSDFHVFPKMKEFLSSRWMETDEEVKETVLDWQPTSMKRGSSSLCNIWTNA
jgi:hypothetical protein